MQPKSNPTLKKLWTKYCLITIYIDNIQGMNCVKGKLTICNAKKNPRCLSFGKEYFKATNPA